MDVTQTNGAAGIPPRTPRYPEVEVELVGQDGNAIAIVTRVRAALLAHDVPHENVVEYLAEALAGDYDNVIQTTMEWVTVH